MRRLIASGVLLSLAIGCGGGPSDAEIESSSAGPRAMSVTQLRTSTRDSRSADPIWSTDFSTSSWSVRLALDVSARYEGHHVETLYVTLPNGSVYEQVTVPFAAGTSPVGGEQQAVALSNGGFRVWVTMPVASTPIQQLPLVGSWSAEAFIDSGRSPVGTTSFSIQRAPVENTEWTSRWIRIKRSLVAHEIARGPTTGDSPSRSGG